jgi:hypothetical protein
MENSRKVVLHPQMLEFLFAFKRKVSVVFRDILGIHEIHHFALARVNQENQLITLSSTPSLEYNLFNSRLWLEDKSYDPQWFHLGSQAYWPSLYKQARYDELYYLKQIKHDFPIGLSLAAKINGHYFIYSFASHKSCSKTRELFAQQQEDFYKIGQYCTRLLSSLFEYCESLTVQKQVDYETSK